MKLKRELQDCFAAEVPQVMFRPLPLVRYPPAGQAVYLLNVPQTAPQTAPQAAPHPRHQPYLY